MMAHHVQLPFRPRSHYPTMLPFGLVQRDPACNFSPPFLVLTSPSHLQQNKLRSSCIWADSHTPRIQCRQLGLSWIFCSLNTPETTGQRPEAVSSPPQFVSTTTGGNRAPFTSSLMFKAIIAVLLFGFLAWVFQAIHPPPPHICGSSGGPSITGPRIKLRDGRHLAYMEHGVPKEVAKFNVILVHGFGSSRHEASIATTEAVQELGVHLVSFDRPGYGESDPDPQRTFKSIALDIVELADQLELGTKFHIIGTSMGGQIVWGCLKYISHRLAGATLICPVINYWWPGFPSNLSTEAYYQQLPQDQWALRVAHHAPWLVHWWNTQKLFPSSSVIAGKPNMSRQDLEILSKLGDRQTPKEYATQQGKFESFHRDTIVGFGKCEFDPMDLKNPFPEGEGSVHLWHGDEDGMVPVTLQRYISEKLPWIHYHEIPGAGHLFAFTDIKEAILRTLLMVEK